MNHSIKGEELKLFQLYTEIITLLDKFQNIKSEKFLSDKKELEDKIMEQSLEEQNKELSYLYRQQKYEKYIYDQLLLAQNGLVDICQKYRTQVHLCETYEMNSVRLKSELDISKDANKKLKQILQRLKIIEKELKKRLNIKDDYNDNNIKVFEPIYSFNDDMNNKLIRLKKNKSFRLKMNNFYKIRNLNRPKTGKRITNNNNINNMNNTALILNHKDTSNNNNNNPNIDINKLKLTTGNNFFKKAISPINNRSNFHKYLSNTKNNFRRTFSRKISFKDKSIKNRTISDHTTNYLTKTRNKSMNDIKKPITIDNNINTDDKSYLDNIINFLKDNINKIREEIKLKKQFKAEEIRSRYQLKRIILKFIEDLEQDLEDMQKENDYDLNKYYNNLFGISDNKDLKKTEKFLYDKKVESHGQRLYVLSYIFNNCFSGVNNIKSIFPKEMLKYISNINK